MVTESNRDVEAAAEEYGGFCCLCETRASSECAQTLNRELVGLCATDRKAHLLVYTHMLEARPLDAHKVLSEEASEAKTASPSTWHLSTNWLTSSGMSTSTTLTRMKLRLRDHLLRCSSLMCLQKTDISLKNNDHSGAGHVTGCFCFCLFVPFTSQNTFHFEKLLLREFALFPMSGIRFLWGRRGRRWCPHPP